MWLEGTQWWHTGQFFRKTSAELPLLLQERSACYWSKVRKWKWCKTKKCCGCWEKGWRTVGIRSSQKMPSVPAASPPVASASQELSCPWLFPVSLICFKQVLSSHAHLSDKPEQQLWTLYAESDTQDRGQFKSFCSALFLIRVDHRDKQRVRRKHGFKLTDGFVSVSGTRRQSEEKFRIRQEQEGTVDPLRRLVRSPGFFAWDCQANPSVCC